MSKQTDINFSLFALGFRPFFVLSGVAALALIALWRSIYDNSLSFVNYYPDIHWHAHEMLLGYTVAVLSGFLLTAVQNWTGRPTVTGSGLAVLSLLWLYGRIVPFYAEKLPDGLIALIDFAYLPFLVYLISLPIFEAKHYKSLVFLLLLSIMIFGNALIHAELLDFAENTAWVGMRIEVATVILLILILAGRIFPFFTERGLSGVMCLRSPVLDALSIASAALVFILDIIGVSSFSLAVIAILAAAFNLLRVSNWYTQRVWYVPLLWILYIGYGWIVLGFVLMALSALSLVLPSLSLHAFTMGGIGVVSLGMMSRVSLGHTGRALKASQAITYGFVLINLAVFCRVFLPIMFPFWYIATVYIAIGLWLAAYSLFAFVYVPILCSPRVDGKPG